MKSQIDFINEIAALHAANPELEIHFCVDSDEVLEFGWTAHRVTGVKVGYWYTSGERIYTSEEEIKDCFAYEIEDDLELESNEIERIVNNRFVDIPKAILVYTCAG